MQLNIILLAQRSPQLTGRSVRPLLDGLVMRRFGNVFASVATCLVLGCGDRGVLRQDKYFRLPLHGNALHLEPGVEK